MDWDKLRIFHAVADAGSLTHAGDALHLSQSAVSRQIRSLEESRAEYERKEQRRACLTEVDKQRVRSLTKDFRSFWEDPKTSSRDRKRMLRLLLEDVTLERREPPRDADDD